MPVTLRGNQLDFPSFTPAPGSPSVLGRRAVSEARSESWRRRRALRGARDNRAGDASRRRPCCGIVIYSEWCRCVREASRAGEKKRAFSSGCRTPMTASHPPAARHRPSSQSRFVRREPCRRASVDDHRAGARAAGRCIEVTTQPVLRYPAVMRCSRHHVAP